MNRKFQFTPLYSIREEENRVIFFSSTLRKIHYFDYELYNLMKDAENMTLEELVNTFVESDHENVRKKISNLFQKLEKDKIIEVIDEESN